MRALRVFASTALVLFVVACETVPIPIQKPVRVSPAAPEPAPPAERTTSTAAVQTPRLYARDGSVVEAAPRGGVEMRSQLSHDLEPSGGGRMYILELYQEVMNERDDLRREVRRLEQANQQKGGVIAESERRYAELEERLVLLETEKRRLVEENLELAGRLTTAQIRRLEAERLLLQARIQEAQEAADAEQAEPVARSEERP